MSKPIHPIEKLRRELWNNLDMPPSKDQEVIARHVKPLLDALEDAHIGKGDELANSLQFPTCRLLAAWRAKC